MHAPTRSLRILLVEDEMLVAMLLEDLLVDIGHQVVGPLSDLGKAVEAARSEALDLAVLDVSLNGHEVYPVAEVLAERGIPFVFATGHGAFGLRERWRHYPTLQKPFHRDDLYSMIDELARSGDPAVDPG